MIRIGRFAANSQLIQLLVLLLLMLSGCSQHQPAPVVHLTSNQAGGNSPLNNSLYQTKGDPSARHHLVRRGETLYSIAWHYGKDVKDLIAWNRLRPPHTIYPGQTLQLGSADTSVANKQKNKTKTDASTTVAVKKAKPAAKVSNTDGGRTSSEVVKSPLVPQTQSGYREDKRQKVDGDHTKKVTVSAASASGSAKEAVKPGVKESSFTGWQWPVEPATSSRLIERFSAANQGIDISGSKGSDIYAAAAGEVVYAGAALRGFGRLLIIKHDNDHLSAYAHNDRLLVAEKETVRAGQPIAQMGSTGSDRVKLHFEIRHKGKPVDPMTLLPALR